MKSGGIAVILFFTGLIICFWIFRADIRPASLWVLQQTKELGWLAPVVFLIAETLMVVFILPGLIFNLGAGFLFGVVYGSTLAVIGTTLGASIAFGIARLFSGKTIAEKFLRFQKVQVFNRFLKTGGWRGILITRLVPMFPFKISNYYFGLAHYQYRDFVLGTLLGIIPLTILNVYLGSLAADLTTLGTKARSPVEWTIYIGGLVVALVLAVLISRKAKRDFTSQNNKDFDVSTH